MPIPLLLICIPLFELWLLITIGAGIGGLLTVFLVVVTAIVGMACLRSQAIMTAFSSMRSTARGEVPAFELFSGALLVFAGLCLLFPGFLTDAIGFLLLWQRVRRRLFDFFSARYGVNTHYRQQHSYRTAKKDDNSGRVIDAEYSEDDTER